MQEKKEYCPPNIPVCYKKCLYETKERIKGIRNSPLLKVIRTFYIAHLIEQLTQSNYSFSKKNAHARNWYNRGGMGQEVVKRCIHAKMNGKV